MSGVVACPVCGSGNARTTDRCWVCGAPLAGAASAGAPPPDRTQTGTQSLRLLGWSALLLALGFTAALIGVELALEWPGLLIPYALIVLVAFAALGRTAWVQIRKPVEVRAAPTTATGDATGPRPSSKITGTDVAQGVALGLTIALAVIAGLILLFVAAIVIFFLICLALVAGSGIH